MANESSGFFDWLKAKVAGQTIKVKSVLEYDTTYNISSLPPNALVTVTMLSTVSGNFVTLPFSAGVANPIIIPTWNTTYAPIYGNGKFTVRYKIASSPDQIQEIDILPIRTKDATNSFQDSVTFDFGVIAYDGEIIIEQSNIPLPIATASVFPLVFPFKLK